MPTSALRKENAPCYQKLAEKICRKIQSGTLAPGARLDPVRQVAKAERLSVATVTKALEVLESLGYVKRVERSGVYVTGSGAKTQKPFAQVGAVLSTLPEDVPYMSLKNVLQPVQERMNRDGLRLSYHTCRWHPSGSSTWEYVPAEEFANIGADALLVMGIFDFHFLSDLSQLDLPVAAFDIDATLLGIDSAALDNIGGAADLTRILLERGHKSIAYIGRSLPVRFQDRLHQSDPCAGERAQGYRAAMQMLAPDRPVRIFHERHKWGGVSAETVEEALKTVPDLTAIVAESFVDHPEIEKRGIEQACFGSGQPRPGLAATAAQASDFREMAMAVTELLKDRMNNPHRPAERRLIQPTIVAY